jgi:hypothetical protein
MWGGSRELRELREWRESSELECLAAPALRSTRIISPHLPSLLIIDLILVRYLLY